MSLISKDFVKIFVAGMLVGIIMSWLFDFMLVSPNKYEENIHTQLEVLKQDEIIKQHSQSEIGLSDDLVQLNAKIYRLENELNEMRRKEASNDSHAALKNRTTVALTITKLIEAGIDEYLAEEIISNREASEYQYLELRNRAIREGYNNTSKYKKELKKIKFSESNIRNNMGEDVYDRYIYAAGRNNRVAISYVMQGTPAEYAGIMVGDIIISYDESRIFTWAELNRATTLGASDESIIVNVQRNGEFVNILIPRGPLGVKLETINMRP